MTQRIPHYQYPNFAVLIEPGDFTSIPSDEFGYLQPQSQPRQERPRIDANLGQWVIDPTVLTGPVDAEAIEWLPEMPDPIRRRLDGNLYSGETIYPLGPNILPGGRSGRLSTHLTYPARVTTNLTYTGHVSSHP